MTRWKRRRGNWAPAAVLLATVAVFVCSCSNTDGSSDSSRAGDDTRLASGDGGSTRTDRTDVDRRLAELEGELRRTRRDARETDSWLRWRDVARLHLAKVQLNGSYREYSRAGRALERAFDAAPGDAGPHLTAGRYHAALHQFDRAEHHLERVRDNPLIGTTQRATTQRLFGTLAQGRGDLEEAVRHYRRSLELKPTAGAAARLALLEFSTGERRRADRRLDAASELQPATSGVTRAWLELQRGVLALRSGGYHEALDHFDRADGIVSGWFLIEEHRAETLALLGRTGASIDQYRTVLARVSLPEFRVALAGVYEQVGNHLLAGQLLAEARHEFERRIRKFPDAAAGHVLGLYLRRGPTDRALELAKRNHELRPGPPASVTLAQAQLQVDRTKKAAETIRQIASSWDTVRYHATAWKAFRAAGQMERAKRARRRAVERNPDVLSNFGWLNHE